MLLQFHAKNITLSDGQKEYIQSKIESVEHLDRHFSDPSVTTHVDIEHTAIADKSHAIEIRVTMTVPQGKFHVEESGMSPEEAIDVLIPKLRHQIEKYKAKFVADQSMPLSMHEDMIDELF